MLEVRVEHTLGLKASPQLGEGFRLLGRRRVEHMRFDGEFLKSHVDVGRSIIAAVIDDATGLDCGLIRMTSDIGPADSIAIDGEMPADIAKSDVARPWLMSKSQRTGKLCGWRRAAILQRNVEFKSDFALIIGLNHAGVIARTGKTNALH